MITARFILFIAACFFLSCSPASLTRIGPAVPARPPDCAIEILDTQVKPSRPYRDIGMVSLQNCQDYREYPCRKWLEEAACELGGQVAYLPEQERPKNNMNAVMFQVFIAAYVTDLLRGEPGQLGLKPAPCDEEAAKAKQKEEELGGKCLE